MVTNILISGQDKSKVEAMSESTKRVILQNGIDIAEEKWLGPEEKTFFQEVLIVHRKKLTESEEPPILLMKETRRLMIKGKDRQDDIEKYKKVDKLFDDLNCPKGVICPTVHIDVSLT